MSTSRTGMLTAASKVFVICASEDSQYFDRLNEQARAAKLLVDFERSQLKQPWLPSWKAQCHTKIYRCNGAIVLLSKNTNTGSIGWELECAREFEMPLLGVHVDKSKTGRVPDVLKAKAVIEWNWPDIARFIESLGKGSSATA